MSRTVLGKALLTLGFVIGLARGNGPLAGYYLSSEYGQLCPANQIAVCPGLFTIPTSCPSLGSACSAIAFRSLDNVEATKCCCCPTSTPDVPIRPPNAGPPAAGLPSGTLGPSGQASGPGPSQSVVSPSPSPNSGSSSSTSPSASSPGSNPAPTGPAQAPSASNLQPSTSGIGGGAPGPAAGGPVIAGIVPVSPTPAPIAPAPAPIAPAPAPIASLIGSQVVLSEPADASSPSDIDFQCATSSYVTGLQVNILTLGNPQSVCALILRCSDNQAQQYSVGGAPQCNAGGSEVISLNGFGTVSGQRLTASDPANSFVTRLEFQSLTDPSQRASGGASTVSGQTVLPFTLTPPDSCYRMIGFEATLRPGTSNERDIYVRYQCF